VRNERNLHIRGVVAREREHRHTAPRDAVAGIFREKADTTLDRRRDHEVIVRVQHDEAGVDPAERLGQLVEKTDVVRKGPDLDVEIPVLPRARHHELAVLAGAVVRKDDRTFEGDVPEVIQQSPEIGRAVESRHHHRERRRVVDEHVSLWGEHDVQQALYRRTPARLRFGHACDARA
jgi:hypothetical protein